MILEAIAGAAPSTMASIRCVREVKSMTGAGKGLYVANREPLAASPLIKLPIGSITPKGWLRQMLELERDGITGHLEELARLNMEYNQDCLFERSGWVNPKGIGTNGEDAPYWLKGYVDLGFVLKDDAVIRNAKRWVDGVLSSQREDGYFGPQSQRTVAKGKPELWPHMPMLNALQGYYEATGDERILLFLTRYFKWQMSLPEGHLLALEWPHNYYAVMRAGDNLESIYWLYNRTGESWLLTLADRLHRVTGDWTKGIASWHGVTIAQGFRQPGVYWMQAKQQKFLDAVERNYQEVMEKYGHVPGGMFAADEHTRPGFWDPRQGAETCSIVEFMHSFEMMTKITGDPLWAERCEDVAFNSFPAALTADQKAMHYITSPNLIQLDRYNKTPGLHQRGTMLAYTAGNGYRCCQHNVGHGWPYYAEELWLATSDGGLCASLYAASEVKAKVADGTVVTIAEETEYPFDANITLKVGSGRAVKFPLYLRLPKWCEQPRIQVNGQALAVAGGMSYAVIEREWSNGDVVVLELPMKVSVRRWEKNKNSASVDYGPLTFSLKIGQRWERSTARAAWGQKPLGGDQWPDWEVFPTTPWNYGLVLDENNPASSFKVVRRDVPKTDSPVPSPQAAQPFTPENTPLEIQAKGRRIAAWTQDGLGLVRTLQASPVYSDAPEETITLIPMGAARLRISSFPVIGQGEGAHRWVASPPVPRTSLKTVYRQTGEDNPESLNDGLLPKNSRDGRVPRYTWWDHKGTTEWVQYDFEKPRRISAAEAYWYDDSPTKDGCRAPASWRILYQSGGEWKDVTAKSPYGVELDRMNRVSFEPVETTAVRLEAKLQPGWCAGMFEWRVE